MLKIIKRKKKVKETGGRTRDLPKQNPCSGDLIWFPSCCALPTGKETQKGPRGFCAPGTHTFLLSRPYSGGQDPRIPCPNSPETASRICTDLLSGLAFLKSSCLQELWTGLDRNLGDHMHVQKASSNRGEPWKKRKESGRGLGVGSRTCFPCTTMFS